PPDQQVRGGGMGGGAVIRLLPWASALTDGTAAAASRWDATFGPDGGSLAASCRAVVYWPCLTYSPLPNA
ncbi:MAG: hypothetical protein ACR2JK_08160, partial [Geodermatophilaceae bacterium]